MKKAEDSAAAAPADAVLGESERLELILLRDQAKNDKATIAELQMQVEFAKKRWRSGSRRNQPIAA